MEEEPKNTTVANVAAATTAKKGKKRKKKKKKISKHIAEALLASSQDQKQEGHNNNENDDNNFPQQQIQQTSDAESPSPQKKLKQTTQETNKKKKKNSSTSSRKTKDPSEAAKYLETWKHDVSHWKFHKNTQSWLIRHMYDFEKVPKHVFALLVEYLQAADAQTITRTRQDATRRALRYQKYTNQNQHHEEEDEKIENNEKETNPHDKNIEKVPTKRENATNGNANINDDDNAHWKSLSDHDKRKEYKRARKVLECLPQNN